MCPEDRALAPPAKDCRRRGARPFWLCEDRIASEYVSAASRSVIVRTDLRQHVGNLLHAALVHLAAKLLSRVICAGWGRGWEGKRIRCRRVALAAYGGASRDRRRVRAGRAWLCAVSRACDAVRTVAGAANLAATAAVSACEHPPGDAPAGRPAGRDSRKRASRRSLTIATVRRQSSRSPEAARRGRCIAGCESCPRRATRAVAAASATARSRPQQAGRLRSARRNCRSAGVSHAGAQAAVISAAMRGASIAISRSRPARDDIETTEVEAVRGFAARGIRPRGGVEQRPVAASNSASRPVS